MSPFIVGLESHEPFLHSINSIVDFQLLSVNNMRLQRVAELLEDFRTLQHHIAAAPTNPHHLDDYYTEGWAALRQCALDGQRILSCGTDYSEPRGRTAEEQEKAELQQSVFQSLIAFYPPTVGI